jgi:hypothetical protein
MKQPTTLYVNGQTYKIRYFTQDPGGPVRAVLHMDWRKILAETGETRGPLQGKEGDEWPMVMVGDKCNGPVAPASFKKPV